MSYQDRLRRSIPGGAHTYSRGSDQFPSNAPPLLVRGRGAYVYDADNVEYLDYGMGLRAVTVGYAEPRINQAAWRQIENGNNLTRPSLVELEAAELLIELIDSVDMVKFTKNGSTAVTAAVKLARAYTGRTLIARCADHAFFSYDDWFIGSTGVPLGVPDDIRRQTLTFRYNDLSSIECLLETHAGQVACVVLEPATEQGPRDDYLQQVKALCQRHGVVFILDEMITGFRWHLKGAQHYFGVAPDLCTFGKGMANGFSVAAVAGRREIMELGSVDRPHQERVFLLSTTHGGEMGGLGAFIETVAMLREENVIDHLWSYGARLSEGLTGLARAIGIGDCFVMSGFPCSPYYTIRDRDGAVSLPLRTIFLQEMIRHRVLMPWIALSYRHTDAELSRTLEAGERALTVVKCALNDGPARFLEGPAVRPVFPG